MPCAYRCGGISATFILVLGVMLGEGIAFAVHLDPSRTDPYALLPSFRAIAGVLWAILWSFGGFVGFIVGYVSTIRQDARIIQTETPSMVLAGAA
jgi:hypothetical protein